MKLTKQQKQIAINKIQEIIKSNNGMVCFCKGNKWTLQDMIVINPNYNNGTLVIGGDQGILASVPLICNNCGNTIFMNAVRLGIIQSKNQSNNDGSEDKLVEWLKNNKDNNENTTN